eukprot:scaffold3438_cov62-Phaeocystis_antarctica.AAC.1
MEAAELEVDGTGFILYVPQLYRLGPLAWPRPVDVDAAVAKLLKKRGVLQVTLPVRVRVTSTPGRRCTPGQRDPEWYFATNYDRFHPAQRFCAARTATAFFGRQTISG